MLIFGGESSEHDVSINSARNVYAAIDKVKYDVQLTYIDRQGRWWLLEDWTESPHEQTTIQLVVAPGTKHFLTVPASKVIPVDVIFPVLHGRFGEDGTIQGLAEMSHIPIIGCGVESSAVCMNKDVTKRIVEAEGIPVVPWVIAQRGDDIKQINTSIKKLDSKGPWFVKPSRAGSSVGVSKIKIFSDLPEAISKAFEHDDIVLIEVAVTGRELEVSVLGNPPNHAASGVAEIIAGSEFYDYDDKYSSESKSKLILDAKLPPALTKVIRKHALEAYKILGCRGLARVDFLLSDDLVPYLNEINTLPGFTNISMFPKQWEQKGMSYSVLVDKLIDLALE